MCIIAALKSFHDDESAQDLVEYVLVIAAVAIAAVAGSNSLANAIHNAIVSLNDRVQNCISASAGGSC